jgi:hypothetical protein
MFCAYTLSTILGDTPINELPARGNGVSNIVVEKTCMVVLMLENGNMHDPYAVTPPNPVTGL